MSDQNIVMGGVRLTDPLEQRLLDDSRIEQLSVDDLRNMTPAVWQQLDRLNRISDKLYIHIDMDVLDPREVMAHGNKVPNGPSSEQLARLFEEIFKRYPKASAIGFATIPPTDEGGLSIAALNRMIAGAVKGVLAASMRRQRPHSQRSATVGSTLAARAAANSAAECRQHRRDQRDDDHPPHPRSRRRRPPRRARSRGPLDHHKSERQSFENHR